MQDCKQFDVLTVVTTVGSMAQAQTLAREIMARRVAACVQIEPGITSHYRWKGALHEETEVRLTIKTLPGSEPVLQALFATEHPYELPQFLGVLESASEAYAQWVRTEVDPPVAGQ
jgi:periplasmic divalent cation tolerance protein